MFQPTPGMWGLPRSWHGWVFLALWAMAVCTALQWPASSMRSTVVLVLFVFVLYVATESRS